MNIWDELSRRFYGFNRDLLKRYTMLAAYGGTTDTWLDHMIIGELDRMVEEGVIRGIR